MIRHFNRGSVRRTLEAGYGVKIAELEPLHGHAHSFNFRATTQDGMAFAVKCFPEEHENLFARLLAHTAPSENPLAATRLFGGKVLGFNGWKVIALKWMSGTRCFPDELTESGVDEFLSAHQKFVGGLADDGLVLPVRDGLSLKRRLLERLKGGNAPEMVSELKQMSDSTLVLAPEAVRIIHGDLHWENFRFDEGRVTGFLDLEELRFGTPAEDLVRYVVCRAEHQRWYDVFGRRRLLKVFRLFLERTPFSRSEWMFAIDGYLLRKLDKKISSGHVPLATRINLRSRFAFYRALRDLVDEVCPRERADGRTVVKMLGGTVRRFMGGADVDWAGRFRFTCDQGCRDYDWLCVYDELPSGYPGVRGGRLRVAPGARTMLITQEPVSVKSYNPVYVRQFDVLLTNRPAEAEKHPGYVKGEGYMVWYTGRSFVAERAHEIPRKTKVLSAIYSAKRMSHTQHGNRYRFLELLKSSVPGFDWYGKGVNPIAEKSDALDEYKYTIAFENHIGEGHWTEKLSDALVAGCLPFYAGDPSIGGLLPADCFIPIPADDPEKALSIVKAAIESGEWERRRGAIARARDLLMERYNLFAQVAAACDAASSRPVANGPGRFIYTRHRVRMNPKAALYDLIQHVKRPFIRNTGGAPCQKPKSKG